MIYNITNESRFQLQSYIWPQLYIKDHYGYEPWGPFIDFHKRQQRHYVGVFPNRFGKDFSSAAEAATVLFIPRHNVLFIGATLTLAARAFDHMLPMIIPMLKKNNIPFKAHTSDNSKSIVIYPDDPTLTSKAEVKSFRNISSVEGAEYDLIVVGEAADPATSTTWIREKMETRLINRLGSFVMMFTPDMRNPYIYEYIESIKDRPDVLYADAPSLNLTSYDCPYIPDEEIDKQKSLLDPKVFQEKYEGRFVHLNGLVLPSFNPDQHIIPVAPTSPTMQILAAIDWGVSPDPTRLLIAYKIQSVYYIVAEYEWKETPISSIINDLHSIIVEYKIAVIVADHDAFAVEECRSSGIPIIKANKTRIIDGVTALDSMFALNKILLVSSRTPYLLDELSKYVWAEKGSKPIDAYNHSIDALRYLVSFTPPVPSDSHITYTDTIYGQNTLGIGHSPSYISDVFINRGR